MKLHAIPVLALLCHTLACASHEGAQSSPTPESPSTQVPLEQQRDTRLDDLSGKSVLLVTHPVPSVLNVYHSIQNSGALGVDDLFVLGIYHQAESESYAASRDLLGDLGSSGIGLHELDCSLEPDEIYTANDCSQVFQELFTVADGVIFSGGADLPPELYGEPTLLTTVIETPRRHLWELSFLAQLLGSPRAPGLQALMESRPDFLVMGICLGMQSMNVATGGTLVQDIPSEIYGIDTYEGLHGLLPAQLHRNPERFLHPDEGQPYGVYHPLAVSGAEHLWGWAAEQQSQVQVLSIHHQAVESPGLDLEVIATSADGRVVEALRHRRFTNVLGVQFHPEYFGRNKVTGGLDPLAQTPATRAFNERFWEAFGQRLMVSAQDGPAAAP